jgi:hypothetical protein
MFLAPCWSQYVLACAVAAVGSAIYNHITACNVCHQVTTLAFADTGDFNLFQDTDGSGCVD